jgi:serine incorporator 1/3
VIDERSLDFIGVSSAVAFDSRRCFLLSLLPPVGGVLFILVQQLMVVDMSHNWNNSWVEKSNQAEEQERGSGKKWLVAVLLSCLTMFAVTIAALVYLFVEFTGCPTNNAFIAVTLVGIVAVTVAQLTGEEGSLLSSAVVSLWATYLAYSAVTKNPDPTCNPSLGLPTIANIVLGLFVCALGLGYTGWSYTAEDKLSSNSKSTEAAAAATTTGTDAAAASTTTPYQSATDDNQGGGKKVTGVVVSSNADDEEAGRIGNGGAAHDDDDNENHPLSSDPGTLSNSWRLNAILAFICCWTAVVLTEWGSVKGSGDVANPQTGNVAMWMVVASQWVVLVLYVWTLVAPRLFPNRDFS